MISHDKPMPSRCTDDAVVIRRVGVDQRRQALAMLLTGRSHTFVEAVDGFFELVDQQKLSLDELWAVYRDEQLLGAMLIIPGAGRASTCLVCPVLEHASVATIGQLMRSACLSQNSQETRIIQALVEPSNHLEIESLRAAGFQEVACLQYMEKRDFTTTTSSELGDSIQALTWSPARRAMFAQAILASYEDTMDCPSLFGLRDIDDIIASHMATGVFSPELWFCLTVAEQPVAVMLLNRMPQQSATELVYLGVRKDWRRQGLGQRLVQFGLAQSQRCGITNMVLAVDESNIPAKVLYRRLGFVAGARKLALIFTLT